MKEADRDSGQYLEDEEENDRGEPVEKKQKL